MKTTILDGKVISNNILQNLKKDILVQLQHGQRAPSLVVLLIGNNPASTVYVKNKINACKKVGITSKIFNLSINITEKELVDLILDLNIDPKIDGILVQLPLPKHINANKILEAINPNKDVDGFHPINIGRLLQGTAVLRPCTPKGIMYLLDSTNVELKGKHVVVVGVSNIVGRPLILELLLKRCTVTACHSETINLQGHIENADILISAIGKIRVISSKWIKEDAIVIDVGINIKEDGTLTGDIDFITAKEKASWITPVPGGVGPMTVAMLLKNTFVANQNQDNKLE